MVLLSFIYAERPSHRLLSRVRQACFRALLSRLQGIICHSEVEVERNGALFGCRATTRFIGLGLHAHGYEQAAPILAPAARYALSAGRSRRDHRSLSQAFAGLNHPLRIVCDNKAATAGVVPLQVSDISAGQMVIIQTMALRKPIITTRTSTNGHYVRDGWNALEVDQRKQAAISQAVQWPLADPALAAQLPAQGYQTFLTAISMPAFARAVSAQRRNLTRPRSVAVTHAPEAQNTTQHAAHTTPTGSPQMKELARFAQITLPPWAKTMIKKDARSGLSARCLASWTLRPLA